MEGLLLGGLSLLGNKIYTDDNNKNYLYNKNVYNSDIENQMNNIEAQQANSIKQVNNKNKQPEFFKQFDSLTFDNLSKPVGINESYNTKNGFNKQMQNELDFNNGYSEYSDSDMNYGVVTRENFVHNNMQPFTKRRDTTINLPSFTRKYEKLSGNDSAYFHKKEVYTFFEPREFGNNVHGLPVVAGELKNRYIASFKNQNGNLPFQTQGRVLPGLNGQVAAPYAVTRVDPRNIDELRSDSNKKESYLHKPLETIKKGEFRAVDPNLTTFKMPGYRNIEFTDLVPNKHYVEGERKTGEFAHTDTGRGQVDQTQHAGGATDTRQGKFYNNYTFTDPKKENYNNDFTHAINAVNSRPVFTNIGSWCNYVTDRGSNDTEVHASGAHNNESAGYTTIDKARETLREGMNYDNPANASSTYQNIHAPIQDKAKQTLREGMNYDNPANASSLYQNTRAPIQDEVRKTLREGMTYDNPSNLKPTYSNPYKQLDDEAKTTIRETSNYDNPSNLKPTYGNPYKQLDDEAKTTIRETSNYDNPSNLKPTYGNPYKQLDDEAKTTIRETSNYDNPSNLKPTYGNPYKQLDDEAKTTIRETSNYDNPSNLASMYTSGYSEFQDDVRNTIKQTLLHASQGGRMYNNNEAQYKTIEKPQTTIKDTTLIENYNGVATHNVDGPRIEDAELNMTIQDKRQQTALGGRISNAKSDQIRGDINRDTVRFQDRKTLLRGYVSSGNISTNYIGIKNCTNHKTNLNTNNFYRIDPLYTNTLDNNPLVNDLHHPKLVDFIPM